MTAAMTLLVVGASLAQGAAVAPEAPLARYAPGARVLHLFHDREEFTVVGAVAGLAPAPAAASA